MATGYSDHVTLRLIIKLTTKAATAAESKMIEIISQVNFFCGLLISP